MEKSIQTLIDEELNRDNSKNRKRSGKYIASNLGRCYRLQYWYRLGEPFSEELDARTLRVFKAGDLFHEFVQNIVSKQENVQIELQGEDDDFIWRADIVLPDEVIECKSQHSRAFWHNKKAREEGKFEEKKEPNILQATFNAMKFNKPKARLVMISKDDLCIDEYIFFVDKWKEKLNNEINTLMDWWAKKELPPAEPRAYKSFKKDGTIEIKDCDYCPFKTTCVETEKGKEEQNGT